MLSRHPSSLFLNVSIRGEEARTCFPYNLLALTFALFALLTFNFSDSRRRIRLIIARYVCASRIRTDHRAKISRVTPLRAKIACRTCYLLRKGFADNFFISFF